MAFDLKSYLLGKQDKPFVGAYDLPSWLMGKAQSGDTKTISGTLPFYVRSRASQILENYIIYGTASGAGVETENLFDISIFEEIGETTFKSKKITLEPNTAYTMSSNASLIPKGGGASIVLFSVGESPTTANNGVYEDHPTTRTTNANGELYIGLRNGLPSLEYDVTIYKTMLTEGSTAPSTYIPHGYKLPITVTSNGTTTDYPVYIGDTQLGEEEYVDYEEQKVYKLVDGTLTPTEPPVPLPDIALPRATVAIDIDGDPKPQATVKGKIEQIT